MFLEKEYIKQIIKHQYDIGSEYFDINFGANNNGYNIDKILSLSDRILNDDFNYDFKGKTCAIIGSSPNVMNSENGKFIDEHDYIVRCNLGRVDGFEKYVGSKTNFRVISSKSFGYKEYKICSTHDFGFFPSRKNEHFIIKPPINENYRWTVGGLINIIDSNNKTSIVSPESLKTISSNFEHMKEPTTGFLAIILFLQFFDKIDIFGFDFYTSKDNFHYFEKCPPSSAGELHSFKEEENYCKELQLNKKIKIH